MKKIFRSLVGFLRALHTEPFLQGLCFSAGVIVFAELIVIGLMYQIKGKVAVTDHLNLIFWKWQLPFAVSRLWDVFLWPVCIFALHKIISAADDDEFENTITHEHDGAFDHLFYCVAGAFLGGVVFGAVYAVPFGILIEVFFLVVVFIWCPVSGLLGVLRDRISTRKNEAEKIQESRS